RNQGNQLRPRSHRRWSIRIVSCPRPVASRPSPSPSLVTGRKNCFAYGQFEAQELGSGQRPNLFFDARLPIWQRLNDGRELLGRTARFEPIADVALLGARLPDFREVEDADALGGSMESFCDLFGMIATSLVVVGNDDHISIAQALGKFGAPLPGAPWIACRDQPLGAKSVNVLLPLG